MKTLILNGSPHKNGDTAALIDRLCRRLTGEVEIFNAYEGNFSACCDCRYCIKNSGCRIDDDIQRLYAHIRECENIVIASPVHFSELSGRLLMAASRFQTFYCARRFRGEEPIAKAKRGAVILVGGGDGSADKAFSTAKALLHILNCTEIYPLISSLDTSHLPADMDTAALAAVDATAGSFNKNYESGVK